MVEAILVYITLIDSQKIGPILFNCYFPTYDILQIFTFMQFSKKSLFTLLIYINEVLFATIQHISIILNICFCYDLIQTLSNPFEVAKSRIITFLTISITIPLIFAAVIFLTIGQKYPSDYYEKEYEDKVREFLYPDFVREVSAPQYLKSRMVYNIGMSITLTLFIMMGIYSIIFAYRRLKRPGVSIQMRRLFLKKHVLYVIVLICIQLLQFLINYFDLLKHSALNTDIQTTSSLQTRATVDMISYLAMLSTGFIISIIRTYDPFFTFLIK